MVLALISIVIGAVAINIRHLVQQQKFQNEVNVVVDLLNRAQQLMVIYNQNVRVKFSVTAKGIQPKIEIDCLLDPQWEKWLTRHSKILTEIHSLNFKDLTFPERSETERMIHFMPNGGGISRGIMSLSTAKETGITGAFDAYICLPGYTASIKSEMTNPKNCDENPDPKIALITRNEVLERALREP